MPGLVYIAGPLFTPAERSYLDALAHAVESTGQQTYLPHRDGGLACATDRNTGVFFTADLRAIEECETLVAVLNGSDVDSGTAFEIGYAYARSKRILAVYEDTRIADPATDVNLMIANATKIFSDKTALLAELTVSRG